MHSEIIEALAVLHSHLFVQIEIVLWRGFDSFELQNTSHLAVGFAIFSQSVI